MNREISAAEVRLVGVDNEQLGIVKFMDALRLAEDKDLDLVEIAPNAAPPV
ncbi:translation initiation factor IF-3, partial [Staphylococcus aureus]|nr:translation initiation factor IF-3 [Staphylococcus aureus]